MSITFTHMYVPLYFQVNEACEVAVAAGNADLALLPSLSLVPSLSHSRYMYVYTSYDIYIHTHIYIYMPEHVFMFIYICMYMYIYICEYIYMYK